MLKKIYKLASSVKLAVWLLFLLALLGALGTSGVIPQGGAAAQYSERLGKVGDLIIALGLDNYYRSIPFRGLFLLLLVNLVLCGASRTKVGFLDYFANGKANFSLGVLEREDAVRALRATGFSVSVGSDSAVFRRRWGFLGFPLVHIAPVLIILGALIGSEAGYIGTKIITVGDIALTFLDWSVEEERELPFVVHVKDRVTTFYQGKLRLSGLKNDGSTGAEFTAEVGRITPIPDTPYSLLVEEYNPETNDMRYFIKDGASTKGPYSKGIEKDAPLLIRPLAYKGFEVRQVVALVDLYPSEGKEDVTSAEISVNAPLDYGPYRIFLTAWGEDEEGAPYVGFQVTRDPGERLVWIGSIFLLIGIFVLIFFKGGWARWADGELKVKGSRSLIENLRCSFSKEEKSL